MKKTSSKKILLSILAIGVSTFLLYWCFHQVDLNLFWTGLKQVRLPILIFAFSLSLVVLCFQALQWKILLPPKIHLSFKKIFQVVSVFWMTVNIMPFWGGHALAVYLLGHKEKVGKTVTVSLLTLDQITNGFAKLALFAVAALVTPVPDWMKKGMFSFLLLILIVYSLFFALAYHYRNLKTDEDIPRKFGFKKISHLISTWAHHLHALRNFRQISAAIILCLAMKAIEIFAIFLVQRSFGLDLPWWSCILIKAALGVSLTLPITPGNLGVYEGTAFVIYRYLGLDPTQAALLGLFHHLVQISFIIVTGYIVSLKIGIKGEMIASRREASISLPPLTEES